MLRRTSLETLGTVLLLSTFGDARDADHRGDSDDRDREPSRRKPRAWTRWHRDDREDRAN